MEIKVREGAKLPRAKQRRFTREEAQEIKRQVEELLRLGKIRVSRSESAVGHCLFLNQTELNGGVWIYGP